MEGGVLRKGEGGISVFEDSDARLSKEMELSEGGTEPSGLPDLRVGEVCVVFPILELCKS